MASPTKKIGRITKSMVAVYAAIPANAKPQTSSGVKQQTPATSAAQKPALVYLLCLIKFISSNYLLVAQVDRVCLHKSKKHSSRLDGVLKSHHNLDTPKNTGMNPRALFQQLSTHSLNK